MEISTVVQFRNTRQTLREEDGWKLVFCFDHFKKKYWYEVESPSGPLNFNTYNIYTAIDYLNQELRGEN